MEADRAYWQELADLVGWRLHGWSGFSASFFTGKEPKKVYTGEPLYDAIVPQRTHAGDFLTLNKPQRDDIVAAIRGARRNAALVLAAYRKERGNVLDAYLTPEQVAERLHLSVETIYRWLRSRKLGGSRISHKAWRVAARDVESFVHQHRVPLFEPPTRLAPRGKILGLPIR